MQKYLKNFFVLSLLMLFFYNISGLSLQVEHARHSKSFSAKAKHQKSEKRSSISQDDECQCALHMHMNHVLLPDALRIEFPMSNLADGHIPHTKAVTYRCLLDYFSSRAPPSLS